MVNPVLSAVLSGQRKILLSWTFGSNADFQVFWKSSSPAGQEFVLLATTNAFSFTTENLDPSKIYSFYVKASVGVTFFYSNVVELFVSCGKGVVLSSTPPVPPLDQIVYDEWIYRCVLGGDIYKLHLAAEGADWIPLNQTSRLWSGITCCPNGNVWACTGGYGGALNSNMYRQSGGAGDFIQVSNFNYFAWTCVVSDINNNLYAQDLNGALGYWYKPAASDTFVWVSQPSTGPYYIKSGIGNKEGDMYLSTDSNAGDGLVWKRTTGAGDFVVFSAPPGGGYRGWMSMSWSKLGNLYCVAPNDVHGTLGRYPGGSPPIEYANPVAYGGEYGVVSSKYGQQYTVNYDGRLAKYTGETGVATREYITGLTESRGEGQLAMTDWWK